MARGVLVNLPHSGGVYDQHEGLLHLMSIAQQAWYIFKYMPTNDIKWKPADAEFIDWVNHGSD
jgi:hypothetical protein